MKYGYARVSSRGQLDGNSLEQQERLLIENGAVQVFKEQFTGTKMDRPEFTKLLKLLQPGDTLIVTKLDRFARSMMQGSELVKELLDKGIKVNIINIGMMDNTPASTLIRNIFFAFAQFERDMIVERTQEGKAVAKMRDDFVEGRPVVHKKKAIEHALSLLATHSYKEVSEKTGISKSTLIRAKKKMSL